jgi:hypothetical protein
MGVRKEDIIDRVKKGGFVFLYTNQKGPSSILYIQACCFR